MYKHRIELDVNPFTIDGRMELTCLEFPELDDHLDLLEAVKEKIKTGEAGSWRWQGSWRRLSS